MDSHQLCRVVKLSRNIQRFQDFRKAPLNPSFFDIPYLGERFHPAVELLPALLFTNAGILANFFRMVSIFADQIG